MTWIGRKPVSSHQVHSVDIRDCHLPWVNSDAPAPSPSVSTGVDDEVVDARESSDF